MSQTTYTKVPAEAFPGMLADSGPNRMVSRALEEASAIDFGKPLRAGTDPAVQVLLPSAASQDFQGIGVHRHSEQARTSGAAQSQPKENMDVLREGHIFVLVEATVVPGDSVAYRHTTAGPLDPGGWGPLVDANTTDISAFARWEKGASADGIAILALNMP